MLAQEARNNAATKTKKLASYKCKKNGARDFGTVVPLPLDL